MLCAAAGILMMLFFSYRTAKRRGLDEVEMIITELVAFIGVAVGSHLLYGITNIDKIAVIVRNPDKITSLKHLWECISEIFGGAVFYGGLIGGIIVGNLYLRKKNLSSAYTDIAACAIPLFHTFGRIGCFLGGCCYGKECSVGFVYKNSLLPDANGVVRFPIQLVESAFNLILFIVLWRLLMKDKFQGKLLVVYLLSYAPARFIIEFFRGDDIRGFLFSLSTSQIVSILIVLTVTGILLYNKVKKPKDNT